MREVWKDIENYKGVYQVSNLGKVKSLHRTIKDTKGRKRRIKGTILKLRPDGLKRYLRVQLCKNGVGKEMLVHRLVALEFVSNLSNYPEVNHIDGNTKNNVHTNLEWCDRRYNIQHSYDIGSRKPTHLTREQCHLSKLTSEEVLEVIEMRKKEIKYKHIANKFNMSISGLEKIINKSKKEGLL